MSGRAARGSIFSRGPGQGGGVERGFGWTEAKVPLGAGWEVRPGQVVESMSSGLRPVALEKYEQYLGKHS